MYESNMAWYGVLDFEAKRHRFNYEPGFIISQFY